MTTTNVCKLGALALALTAACGGGDVGLPDARYDLGFFTTIDDGPPAATSSTTASFAFTATAPATFICQVDDRAPEPCTSPYATTVDVDGDHVFLVTATRDADGVVERNPPAHAWRLDRDPPETSYVAGPPGLTASTTITFSFGSDEPGVTYLCALDGAPAVPCDSPYVLTGLADGEHVLVITAVDAAGNPDPTPLVVTWTVDSRVPDTVIDAGPPALVGPAPVELVFSTPTADLGDTLECALDGAAYAACTSPLTLTNLATGEHVLLVRAVTAAGAVDPTPAIHAWTVDATVPDTVIDAAPTGTVGPAGLTPIAFSSPTGVSFECSLVPDGDAPSFAACTSPYAIGALGTGAYRFAVRATNQVGTVDPTPAEQAFAVDATPPVVTITSPPTDPTPWRTEDAVGFTVDDATAVVECRVDARPFTACAATFATPRLTGGVHTVDIRATDPYGNVGTGSDTWQVEYPLWTEGVVAKPTPRAFHAMAYDSARGEVVLFGGTPNNTFNTVLADTWIWDGVRWSQRTPATSPPGRMLPAMAYDPARAEIVMFGGYLGTTLTTNDTWTWDGVTWSQRAPATSPPARGGAAMAFHAATGVTVLHGGAADVSAGSALADTWRWDGTTWTDAAPATSPSARSLHTLAALPAASALVLFGGRSPSNGLLAETWRWDGTTWAQATPATSPPARGLHAGATDDAGLVIVTGGHVGGAASNQTWTYDGTTWAARPAATGLRQASALAYDGSRGETVLFGGNNNAAVIYDDTHRWRAGAWSATLPPQVNSHGVAYDAARGELVNYVLGQTWTWDGSAWTLRQPPTAPPSRGDARIEYDAARQEVVMFGGASGPTLRTDTWTWDGTTWTDRTGALSPPGRTQHSMAYDAAREQVVMFGGNNGTNVGYADTWLWDGTAWTLAAPATSPPSRDGFGMAYDAIAEEVVLFGGLGNNQTVRLADTWVWNGTTWAPRALGVGPTARNYHDLVSDPGHAAVLLYSGTTSAGQLGDLWSWDGTTWTLEPQVAPFPVPRRYPRMTYDVDAGRVVMVGGRDTGGVDRNDVWTIE
ncbi:MAG: kelch repeat-containing protein [Kofleriaceae bacterium]